MRQGRGRRTLVLAPLAFVLLTACSSSGGGDAGIAAADGGAGTPAPAAAAPSATDASSSQLAFAQCLRKQGLNVPDPNPNDPQALGQALRDIPTDKRTAAIDACQRYLSGAAVDNSGTRQQLLAYFQCLRAHGADVDDPDPTTGRPDQKDIDALRNPDAAMRKAEAACTSSRPNAGSNDASSS
jgi:hypothetical protein